MINFIFYELKFSTYDVRLIVFDNIWPHFLVIRKNGALVSFGRSISSLNIGATYYKSIVRGTQEILRRDVVLFF